MSRTIIPAAANETAVEIFIENGVVARQRMHRIIAWSIDGEGSPQPIGVTGPIGECSSGKPGHFLYQQPGLGVHLLCQADDWYYETIQDAVTMIVDAAAHGRAYLERESARPGQGVPVRRH
jgi:hypothetical protein